MFTKGAKWHCFFFDYDDIGGEHHTGPHVHYLSHRWAVPGLERETVWAAFEERRQSLPREHISYIDESDPRPGRPRGEKFFGSGESYHILRVDRPPPDQNDQPAAPGDTDSEGTEDD
jgi:hypothetical protein